MMFGYGDTNNLLALRSVVVRSASDAAVYSDCVQESALWSTSTHKHCNSTTTNNDDDSSN